MRQSHYHENFHLNENEMWISTKSWFAKRIVVSGINLFFEAQTMGKKIWTYREQRKWLIVFSYFRLVKRLLYHYIKVYNVLNSLAYRQYGDNIRIIFFNPYESNITWAFPGKWRQMNSTKPRWWLGGKQAITWASIYPDLCRHMASLDHNALSNDLIGHVWAHIHGSIINDVHGILFILWLMVHLLSSTMVQNIYCKTNTSYRVGDVFVYSKLYHNHHNEKDCVLRFERILRSRPNL